MAVLSRPLRPQALTHRRSAPQPLPDLQCRSAIDPVNCSLELTQAVSSSPVASLPVPFVPRPHAQWQFEHFLHGNFEPISLFHSPDSRPLTWPPDHETETDQPLTHDGSRQFLEQTLPCRSVPLSPPTDIALLPDQSTITCSAFEPPIEPAPLPQLSYDVMPFLRPYRPPTTFAGDASVAWQWLADLQRHCEMNECSDSLAYDLACALMVGPAQDWLEIHLPLMPTWPHFVCLFRATFATSAVPSAQFRRALSIRRLRTDEQILDYALEVLHLCTVVDPAMTDQNQLEHLLAGLPSNRWNSLFALQLKSVAEFLATCRVICGVSDMWSPSESYPPSPEQSAHLQSLMDDLQSCIDQLAHPLPETERFKSFLAEPPPTIPELGPFICAPSGGDSEKPSSVEPRPLSFSDAEADTDWSTSSLLPDAPTKTDPVLPVPSQSRPESLENRPMANPFGAEIDPAVLPTLTSPVGLSNDSSPMQKLNDSYCFETDRASPCCLSCSKKLPTALFANRPPNTSLWPEFECSKPHDLPIPNEPPPTVLSAQDSPCFPFSSSFAADPNCTLSLSRTVLSAQECVFLNSQNFSKAPPLVFFETKPPTKNQQQCASFRTFPESALPLSLRPNANPTSPCLALSPPIRPLPKLTVPDLLPTDPIAQNPDLPKEPDRKPQLPRPASSDLCPHRLVFTGSFAAVSLTDSLHPVTSHALPCSLQIFAASSPEAPLTLIRSIGPLRNLIAPDLLTGSQSPRVPRSVALSVSLAIALTSANCVPLPSPLNCAVLPSVVHLAPFLSEAAIRNFAGSRPPPYRSKTAAADRAPPLNRPMSPSMLPVARQHRRSPDRRSADICPSKCSNCPQPSAKFSASVPPMSQTNPTKLRVPREPALIVLSAPTGRSSEPPKQSPESQPVHSPPALPDSRAPFCGVSVASRHRFSAPLCPVRDPSFASVCVPRAQCFGCADLCLRILPTVLLCFVFVLLSCVSASFHSGAFWNALCAMCFSAALAEHLIAPTPLGSTAVSLLTLAAAALSNLTADSVLAHAFPFPPDQAPFPALGSAPRPPPDPFLSLTTPTSQPLSPFSRLLSPVLYRGSLRTLPPPARFRRLAEAPDRSSRTSDQSLLLPNSVALPILRPRRLLRPLSSLCSAARDDPSPTTPLFKAPRRCFRGRGALIRTRGRLPQTPSPPIELSELLFSELFAWL